MLPGPGRIGTQTINTFVYSGAKTAGHLLGQMFFICLDGFLVEQKFPGGVAR